jgi:hypothetical protein
MREQIENRLQKKWTQYKNSNYGMTKNKNFGKGKLPSWKYQEIMMIYFLRVF